MPVFRGNCVPIRLSLNLRLLQRADIVLLTMFVGPSMTAVYAASEFLTRVIGNARNVFDGVDNFDAGDLHTCVLADACESLLNRE